MTEVQQLARFVTAADFSQLSSRALEQLKIRVVDTIGIAIAALDAEPLIAIRALTETLGGNHASTLIGGGSSAPDRAAFYNIALSRYLDFMDSYLAAGETNHPSDNIGAVLAAAESVGASGKDFLTAVAVAYQVHTRLSDVAPVRAKGFDHTVQGAYAVAAAVSKVLGLNAEQTANAIAISGNKLYPIEIARAIHFLVMLYFVLFIIVHVTLVLATGALNNLNHMYAMRDDTSWIGFWIFAASLVVIIVVWIAARPLFLQPIAALTGTLSRR